MANYFHRSNFAQIRNSSIICYTTTETNYKSLNTSQWQKGHNDTPETDEKAAYSGIVTKGAKKRIRTATDILLQCTEPHEIYNPIIKQTVTHRLSFVTLTLSDNSRFISAAECYKTCLKPFLDWLRRTQNAKFYIWKAERQKQTDKKGNEKKSKGQLHYHITTEAFILYGDLRTKWNTLQQKAGYLDNYHKTYKSYNPNSTDIHAVYKIDNLEAYLTKYISKEATKLDTETDEEFKARCTVDGKVWDCSSNLRGAKYFVTEYSENIHKNIVVGMAQNRVRSIPNDNAGIYCLNVGKPVDFLNANEWLDYCYYKKKIINNDNDSKE